MMMHLFNFIERASQLQRSHRKLYHLPRLCKEEKQERTCEKRSQWRIAGLTIRGRGVIPCLRLPCASLARGVATDLLTAIRSKGSLLMTVWRIVTDPPTNIPIPNPMAMLPHT